MTGPSCRTRRGAARRLALALLAPARTAAQTVHGCSCLPTFSLASADYTGCTGTHSNRHTVPGSGGNNTWCMISPPAVGRCGFEAKKKGESYWYDECVGTQTFGFVPPSPQAPPAPPSAPTPRAPPPAPPFAATVAAATSSSSCERLGWGISALSSACTHAKQAGECAHDVTWEAARVRCEGAGARLCKASELAALPPKAPSATSGCDLDHLPVWAADACGASGRVSALVGGTSGGCGAPTNWATALCCADSEAALAAAAGRAAGGGGGGDGTALLLAVLLVLGLVGAYCGVQRLRKGARPRAPPMGASDDAAWQSAPGGRSRAYGDELDEAESPQPAGRPSHGRHEPAGGARSGVELPTIEMSPSSRAAEDGDEFVNTTRVGASRASRGLPAEHAPTQWD